MHRVGKKNNAHSHGTYIRPEYVDVWSFMEERAAKHGTSTSHFVNYALFVLMTGTEPSDSPLTGRTPFSGSVEVFRVKAARARRRTRKKGKAA